LPARFAIAACALLAGCAAVPHAPATALAGRIWDAQAGHFVEEPELARRIRKARYVLLGEVHDNPAHHESRARLIGVLSPQTEIFFEQFDRPRDAALREAQRAGAEADALARAGQMDAGWNWPLYRPLVEAALAGRQPVRAANLPNAETRRIAGAGKLGTADAALADALARSHWTEADERALHEEIVESHCRALPARLAPAMALAQRARDATMALALADSPGNAVLLAGNGHVRRDLGVPRYLPRDSTVLSVGLLEIRDGEPDPRAYATGETGGPAYDYVWFTPRQARPDPCKGFKLGLHR
jgi:uncharacterized iron-regulated protein